MPERTSRIGQQRLRDEYGRFTSVNAPKRLPVPDDDQPVISPNAVVRLGYPHVEDHDHFIGEMDAAFDGILGELHEAFNRADQHLHHHFPDAPRGALVVWRDPAPAPAPRRTWWQRLGGGS